MKIKLIVVAVLATAIMVPSFVSWAKVPAGAKTYAKLVKCTSSKKAARRGVTMRATMSTASRDVAMRMRYKFLERFSADSDWRDVTPDKLQKWLEKPAGVDKFKSRFRVRNLSAPANYRAVVSYEWTRDGEVVGSSSRRTNICRVRSKQPDLAAKLVMIRQGLDNMTWNYVFLVSNVGSRTAKNFKMEIRIAEGVVVSRTVRSLRRNRVARLDKIEQRCSGAPIRGVVDSENNVSEGNEKNNSVSIDCPLL